MSRLSQMIQIDACQGHYKNFVFENYSRKYIKGKSSVYFFFGKMFRLILMFFRSKNAGELFDLPGVADPQRQPRLYTMRPRVPRSLRHAMVRVEEELSTV